MNSAYTQEINTHNQSAMIYQSTILQLCPLSTLLTCQKIHFSFIYIQNVFTYMNIHHIISHTSDVISYLFNPHSWATPCVLPTTIKKSFKKSITILWKIEVLKQKYGMHQWYYNPIRLQWNIFRFVVVKLMLSLDVHVEENVHILWRKMTFRTITPFTLGRKTGPIPNSKKWCIFPILPYKFPIACKFWSNNQFSKAILKNSLRLEHQLLKYKIYKKNKQTVLFFI